MLIRGACTVPLSIKATAQRNQHGELCLAVRSASPSRGHMARQGKAEDADTRACSL
jgi:phage gp46-like protein